MGEGDGGTKRAREFPWDVSTAGSSAPKKVVLKRMAPHLAFSQTLPSVLPIYTGAQKTSTVFKPTGDNSLRSEQNALQNSNQAAAKQGTIHATTPKQQIILPASSEQGKILEGPYADLAIKDLTASTVSKPTGDNPLRSEQNALQSSNHAAAKQEKIYAITPKLQKSLPASSEQKKILEDLVRDGSTAESSAPELTIAEMLLRIKKKLVAGDPGLGGLVRDGKTVGSTVPELTIAEMLLQIKEEVVQKRISQHLEFAQTLPSAPPIYTEVQKSSTESKPIGDHSVRSEQNALESSNQAAKEQERIHATTPNQQQILLASTEKENITQEPRAGLGNTCTVNHADIAGKACLPAMCDDAGGTKRQLEVPWSVKDGSTKVPSSPKLLCGERLRQTTKVVDKRTSHLLQPTQAHPSTQPIYIGDQKTSTVSKPTGDNSVRSEQSALQSSNQAAETEERIHANTPRQQILPPSVEQKKISHEPHAILGDACTATHADIAKKVRKVLQHAYSHPSSIPFPLSTDFMYAQLLCKVCRRIITDTESLLVCDSCGKGTHLKCLALSDLKCLASLCWSSDVRMVEWRCAACLLSCNSKHWLSKYRKVDKLTIKPVEPGVTMARGNGIASSSTSGSKENVDQVPESKVDGADRHGDEDFQLLRPCGNVSSSNSHSKENVQKVPEREVDGAESHGDEDIQPLCPLGTVSISIAGSEENADQVQESKVDGTDGRGDEYCQLLSPSGNVDQAQESKVDRADSRGDEYCQLLSPSGNVSSSTSGKKENVQQVPEREVDGAESHGDEDIQPLRPSGNVSTSTSGPEENAQAPESKGDGTDNRGDEDFRTLHLEMSQTLQGEKNASHNVAQSLQACNAPADHVSSQKGVPLELLRRISSLKEQYSAVVRFEALRACIANVRLAETMKDLDDDEVFHVWMKSFM